MPRVTIFGPESTVRDSIELSKGESLVVGRRVREVERPEGTSIVTLEDPSVSSEHVAVDYGETGLVVADLGTTNGTLLEIPRGGRATLDGDRDVFVHVAPSIGASRSTGLPEDARYTDAAEYAASIVRALECWAVARKLPLRVSCVPGNGAPLQIGHVPLASGAVIVLDTEGTVPRAFLDSISIVERYIARQNRRFAALEEARANGMIVASPAMRAALLRTLEAASNGARTLLLIGPDGSGKEDLARFFHRMSARSGSFVARRGGATTLGRPSLFGAERGSFDGCDQRIVGAVEMANFGTIFLDDLSDLPAEVQPLLLRLLDRGEFERMGRYGQPRVADVAMVVGTTKDLRAASLRNEFRLDLWFRLSTDVVEIPPLRQRFADVEAYLRSRTIGDGSIWSKLDPSAVDRLAAHPWNRNQPELEDFADRLSDLSADRIDADTCGAILADPELGAKGTRRSTRPPAPPPPSFEALFRRAERAYLEDHEGSIPTNWDSVKDLVENYVKPILFAELCGTAGVTALDDDLLREAASRVDADRGTAEKQLARYVDRYRAGD